MNANEERLSEKRLSEKRLSEIRRLAHLNDDCEQDDCVDLATQVFEMLDEIEYLRSERERLDIANEQRVGRIDLLNDTTKEVIRSAQEIESLKSKLGVAKTALDLVFKCVTQPDDCYLSGYGLRNAQLELADRVLKALEEIEG
jgi:hypothetical protein